jgi:protein-arginine kinase activator protein McsA
MKGTTTYKICHQCSVNLPENRKNYRSSRIHSKEVFHMVCRTCEDSIKLKPEWFEGKLLCHKCADYKDEVVFTPNNTLNATRNYRRYICNNCNKIRQHKLNASFSEDKKLDKILTSRYRGAVDRSLKSNIEFSISKAFLHDLYIKQKGKCALSNLDMTFELNAGRTPTNLSVDRINPNEGYTENNTQLVCMAINQMKSDFTNDEIYKFCKNFVLTYEEKNKSEEISLKNLVVN